MKAKNHEKLAGFEREFTNSETPEKPVKSRIFGDLQGVKNAPRGLLLSGRPRVRIAPGTPLITPKVLVLQGFRRFLFSGFMQSLLFRFTITFAPILLKKAKGLAKNF